MSVLPSSSDAPRVPRRVALLSLLAATGVIVLPGCGGGGGGGGVAGIDTGGTGSFSTGTISGFGSVIVNGVRFEDNAARVADDDDEVKVLTRDDLKLGMVVRVQAGPIAAGSGDVLPSATATSIIVESQIKGPVETKTAPDTLVVFGQTVKVTAATVFEPGLTFAAINPGVDILEVHGFLDAAGVVTATRIELENAADEFKVRGFITNLVGSTFKIGNASFFAGALLANSVPLSALANGQFVRVRTGTTRNAQGQWIVNRIQLRAAVEDRNEAEVEGILTSVVVNGAPQLQVNGVVINPNGLTVPAIGTRVEVEGAIVNGVLVARKIEVEDENEEAQVDVRGTVSNLNAAAQTFVVHGVTFHFSTATDFRNGSASSLAPNVNVRVRGTLIAGTGTVEATRIDF